MRTYERHQLKQDKFAATTRETISWAVGHRAKLVVGGIIVVVALIAILAGMWGWTYRNQAANEQLGKAMQTYQAPLRPAGAPPVSEMVSFTSAQERARVANGEFQKIAGQYGLTSAGKIARYMAAVTALDMGDSKAGEQGLKDVADSGSDVAALAKLALANLYRQTKRDQDAVNIYKDLIEHPAPSVSKTAAQLELATLYETTNQGGDAVKLYTEVVKADPRSPAAQIAQEHLQSMNK